MIRSMRRALGDVVKRLRNAAAKGLHRAARWVAPTEKANRNDADLSPLWVSAVRSLLDRRPAVPDPPVKQEFTRADVEALARWLGEFSRALVSSLPDRPAVEGGRGAEALPAEDSHTPG